MPYQTYQLTFEGQAGKAIRAEFDDCRVAVGRDTTTLCAELPDRAALAGLIQRITDLRLPLVRVILEPPDSGQPPRDNPIDPAERAPISSAETLITQSAWDAANRHFSVEVPCQRTRTPFASS